MTNKELIKEFEEAHWKATLSRGGFWGHKMPKDMKLLSGYWYWKGHRVVDLAIDPN